MRPGLLVVVFLSLAAAAQAQTYQYQTYPTYPLAGSGVVGTLSSNPYATPPPVIPYVPAVAPTLPTLGGGPAIVGRDGQYLGQLNGNRFDPNSVANPYGTYGSPYAPNSINNPYGTYGSRYAPLSPTNPYATTPPLLIGR
jgi:hypothetical protein